MEENNIKSELEPKTENKLSNQNAIAGAIIIAGIIIAGAILLRGNGAPTPVANLPSTKVTAVSASDRVLGSSNAKLTLIMYEDFQCPFCGRFVQDTEQNLRDTYVKNGQLQLVYRDFAFLGAEAKASGADPVDESLEAAEAARCAEDQNQFWQYHDYLFAHQNGEDQGSFSIAHLETFAKTLGLDTTAFDQCIISNKYEQAVLASKTEGDNAGVTSTPTGFLILSKDISVSTQNAVLQVASIPGSPPLVTFYAQKNIMSINGALPSSMVDKIIDLLLK